MSTATSPNPHLVIVVAHYLPERGGTITQARLHGLEFKRRGWDVTILTRRNWRQWASCSLDGLSVRRTALPGHGRTAKFLALVATVVWLRRHSSHVTQVSAILEADFAIAAHVAGLGDRTTLNWVTDGDASRSLKGILGQARLRVLRQLKNVVLTPRMRSELRELGLEGTVIPVAVDTDHFHPPNDHEVASARTALRVSAKYCIVYVGHIQPRKGVDSLIKALPVLVAENLDVQLFLVGGPQHMKDHRYLDELKALADNPLLANRVVFCGAQANVLPYLFAADAFCLPSHREGMPNAILEAMACGRACVAPSGAGGDSLLNEGAGLIPLDNSSHELSLALVALFRNDSLRFEIGRAAANRVRDLFQPSKIGTEYERLWGIGT